MTRAARRDRRTTAAILLAALVMLAAGCSRAPVAHTAAPAQASSDGTPASASSGPDHAPSEEPPESPEPPEPGSMDRPATESGPLSRADFPKPQALGAGWDYSVDPGDAEEGYAGNGTPALARNPAEVMQLAVPFGCARPRQMPVPEHALEVDYTVQGTKVVTIRGEFEDAEAAGTFFAARRANIERCVGRSGGQAIGTLVSRAETIADDVVLSDRTPESQPWTEVAVLDGDQVVLVAAQTRIGAAPMTPEGARRLAREFRR